MKIIVNIDDVDEIKALSLVSDVIRGGKVSRNTAGKQYCWVTIFGSNGQEKIVVSNKGKRKGSDTESFYIYKDSK